MWYPKTIRAIVFLLCGINCLVQADSNCTLKILQDGIERTDFSCIEYTVPAEACRMPNNGNLPIVDNDTGAIDTVKNFQSDVDRVIQNVSGVKWNLPQLHLSWDLPTAPSSYKKLQGFLVDGVCVDGKSCDTSNFCTIFQLKGSEFTSADWNVKFQYEKVLNISTTYYHLKLYSLPRTLTDGRLVQHHYRTINGFTNNGPSKDSINWRASTKLEFDENNVTISFKYPGFNFTHFVFDLKEFGKKVQSKKFVRFHGSTHAEVTFYNVPTGQYHIAILPDDQYPNDYDKCQCYELDSFGRICMQCKYLETYKFNVTAPAVVTTSIPTTPSSPVAVPVTTSPSSQSSEGPISLASTEPKELVSPTNNDSLTIGLPISLTIILLFGIVLLLYMLKCRKGGEDPSSLQEKSSFDQFKDVAVEEKTVFVLSADDHHPHLEAVKQLVMFLQDKCKCRVIYPPWEIKKIGSQSWRSWLQKSLDEADNVIVVNSEASFNLLKASTSNKSYRYTVLNDSAHLFPEVLAEILKEYKQVENVHRGLPITTTAMGTDSIANRLDTDKFVTVSFYYTPKEYYLTDFRNNFEVLQQLPDLIRKIHKLQLNSHIPIDLKDVFTHDVENNCLLDLKNAISKAGRFEKSDVLWFSERFGDAYRRETERHDSGYDEDDNVSRSRSASQKSDRESTDDFGFYPPSILDVQSRITAPDVSESMSNSNFSFIPPDAVSRGLSEFCAPTDVEFCAPTDDEDGAVCTISRQFRDINKHYENNMCSKI